jgi:hypothetical protein
MTEPWLEPSQYDADDDCPICLESFDALTKKGRRQVIMQFDCGHKFHNNCVHLLCSSSGRPLTCPLCRAEIDENDICMSAYAFKKRAMDLNEFPRDSYVRDVYYETHYPKQYKKSVRRGKNSYANRKSKSRSNSGKSKGGRGTRRRTK